MWHLANKICCRLLSGSLQAVRSEYTITTSTAKQRAFLTNSHPVKSPSHVQIRQLISMSDAFPVMTADTTTGTHNTTSASSTSFMIQILEEREQRTPCPYGTQSAHRKSVFLLHKRRRTKKKKKTLFRDFRLEAHIEVRVCCRVTSLLFTTP